MFMPKDHVVATVAGAPDAGVTVDQDAARWDAVQRKDAGQDGAFVFAVRSTGVYCRPSCAARQPLRRNVEFFDAPAAARAVAGAAIPMAARRARSRCRRSLPRAG